MALSVVGTDRLPDSPYFRAKIAQEKLISSSGLPYSIVHATQFFEFVKSIADSAAVEGVVKLSPALVQPIAGDEVAAAVARTAVCVPLNGLVETAGPEVFGLDAWVRQGLALKGDPREVVADEDAPYFGAILEERTLVPGTDPILSQVRYEDWFLLNIAPR